MDVSSVNSAMQTCDKMKRYVSAGMDTIIDIAMDMIDHSSDLDVNRTDELKDLLCEYAAMEAEMNQFYEAVAHAKKVASRFKEEDVKVPQLEEILEEKLEKIKERDKDVDVKGHLKFVELERRIQRKLEEQRSGQEEDDVQLTEQEVNTKCPVTGKDMVVPVVNTLCGHRYDRVGVTQLLKQRRGKAKCPVAGCGNSEPITEEHLQEDKDMKRYLAKKKRKENVKQK